MPVRVPNETEYNQIITRLNNIEAKNVAQDSKIASIESKDAVQDSKLANLDTRVTQVDQKVIANTAADATNVAALDARLDILEAASTPLQPPTVGLTVQSVNAIATATLSASAKAPATLANWSVTWGDTKENSGLGAPPVSLAHTYAVSGTYKIELTVTDSKGLMARTFLTSAITVTPPTPIPEPVPVPVPVPPTNPPTPPATLGTFLGGWRLDTGGLDVTGSIAINFTTNKLYLGGAGPGILIYDLPAMNGTNVNTWPKLSPSGQINRFWPGTQPGDQGTYPNGLIWWQNKLWVAPRSFYAVDPAATMPLKLYAQDGQTMTFPTLTQQKFSGFVKRGPNQDPYLGCGGYESGQGSQSGPSLARLDGTKLIEYQWPGDPGPGNPPANWNLRAPRDTNYYPADHSYPNQSADYWVAWAPRDTDGDGILEGRWASDVIFGGGLVLQEDRKSVV